MTERRPDTQFDAMMFSDDTSLRPMRPLGEPLEWSAAKFPARRPLEGATVRLDPLTTAHAHDLYQSSHSPIAGPELWDYLPYGPFPSQAQFTLWVERAAADTDPVFFAIRDIRTDHAAGVASFMRIDPENGVIEIGGIWLSPLIQRSRLATEAIFLMMREAFELGYRRLEWKCDALNAASRRAAERFGFKFEGVFRQAQVVKQRNRDTAWYSMLDREWPSVRRALEAWLLDANFDEFGRQRRRLDEIRSSLEQRSH